MRHIVIIAMAAITVMHVMAQDRSANTWYFGRQAGLSFDTDPPTILTNGATNAFEGTAVAADPITGQVLFYTDGSTVWNSAHAVVKQNVCLRCASATMAAIIIPHPGRAGRYYLFVTNDETGQPNSEARVATVDVVGTTVTVSDPVTILTGATEKVTAAKACNGIDYWVIFKRLNAEFVAYRITAAAGFDPNARAVSNGTVAIAGPNYSVVRGEMKISPDGRWVACANENIGIELFQFNNATGTLTVVETFDQGAQHYGVSFSPDSRLLYINTGWQNTTRQVLQYDLAAAPVSGSAIVIGTCAPGQGPGSMQIAPNGKIYMAKQGPPPGSIAVINAPNVRGVGCGFVDAGVVMTAPASVSWGLPNFPQNFFVPQFVRSDTTVCAGQPVILGRPALQGHTYVWTPANAVDDPASAQPTARVTQTTAFTVTVTDPLGCQIVQSITVTTLPLPTITVTNDTAICNPSSIRLQATGGVAYRWRPTTGLDDPTSAAPLATPTTSTTYVVDVTDANGCVSTDSVRITMHPDPVPSLVRNDTSVCAGQPIMLGRPAVQGYTYAWTPSNVLDDPASAQPTATVTQTTTFTLRATEPVLGCEVVQQQTITALPLPVVVTSPDTAVCAGQPAMLRANGGVSYQWRPTTGLNDAASPTPTATPAQTTTYVVDVTGANGCISSDSVTVTVRPNPVPVLQQADTTICSCDSIELIAPAGYVSYVWSDQRTGDRIIVRRPGSYSVTVTDQFGCVGTSNAVRIDTMIATADIDLSFDPAHARDGAVVQLRVSVRTAREIARCLGSSIRIRVGMTPNVLVPQGVTRSADAFMTEEYADVPLLSSLADTVDVLVPCIVTLGKSDTVALRVVSVTSPTCQALVTNGRASFPVDEICRIGGIPRLFYDGVFEGIIVRVVPNPVNGQAVLRVFAHDQSPLTISVDDLTGRAVMRRDDHAPPGWSSIPLDVSSIASGLYVVRVRSSNGASTVLMEVRQ